MQDLVKNSIYTTVGVVSVAQNKFKELVEELIQNGHYTEEEGKRIVDQFFFDLRSRIDDTTGALQVKADELFRKWNVIDLDQLKQAKNDLDVLLKSLRSNPLLPVIMNKRK